MTTIIVGGGIIGLSTAFYLVSEQQCENIIVVDTARQLFTCASGRAAGFLNKSWFSKKTSNLAELSFSLHEELADTNDGYHNWGYRRSQAWSTAVKKDGMSSEEYELLKTERLQSQQQENAGSRRGYNELDEEQKFLVEPDVPDWVFCEDEHTFQIAGAEECAQIHPHRLCEFLLKQCIDMGVEVLHPAQLHSIKTNSDGIVVSAVIRDLHTTMDRTVTDTITLIIAAGAWTSRVFESLFPEGEYHPPITSLAGFSMTVTSPLLRYNGPLPISDPSSTPGSTASSSFDINNDDLDLISHEEENFEVNEADDDSQIRDALFIRTTGRSKWAPELFSRSNGEIYIAGLNAAGFHPSLGSMAPASHFNTEDAVDDTIVEDAEATPQQRSQHLNNFVILKQAAQSLLGPDISILRRSLCLRPVTTTGEPIMGLVLPCLVSGTKGVYISAGHGPWGISLCLGSGKVMAELINTGKASSADISGLAVKV
ncbi:FAD dependent oxidoreductase [Lipomyces arxii]|uniref:FAD dependent oxidoreductase n=1 Tax=Lipomyces arxii TaxID=56418 RepID=UPI0034CE3DF2